MSRLVIDRRGEAPATGNLLVNGEPLEQREIAAEVANFPAATPAESWAAARQALTLRMVLRQRAAALGIAAVPQADAEGRTETMEDATLRELLAAEVQVSLPDAAEVAAFHAANAERFRAPGLFEASHILFEASPDDATARATAHRNAFAAAATLADDPDRFADLARSLSTCASAASGGVLGQISEGETAPEFEAVLRDLGEGEVSAPVETRFGVHLIRLARRAEGAILPLSSVQGRIAEYLAARATRKATAAYLAGLLEQAVIETVAIPPPRVEEEKLRAFVDHADDERWVQLIGVMNRAEDPAAAGGAAIMAQPGHEHAGH